VSIDIDGPAIIAVASDVRDIVVTVDGSNATSDGADRITKDIGVDVLRFVADLAIDFHYILLSRSQLACGLSIDSLAQRDR
jgi:hypothetical protein